MPARLNNDSALFVAANVFGTIFIGFGVNAIVRPQNALSFFEMDMPTRASDRALVEALLMVYGARDVFMGLAIYATAAAGARRACGWILLAASLVAFVDGLVCWQAGKGEWNHWGYAPMLTILGSAALSRSASGPEQ